MKKKILFCYFGPKIYTPLDLAYILAFIKQKPSQYEIEIVRLKFRKGKLGNLSEYMEEAYYLLSYNPDAVFFFLENIQWSRWYSKGAAERLSEYIKKVNKKIFTGVQSCKISGKDSCELLKKKVWDTVVHKDPEYSFQFLDEIFNKSKVSGVSHYDFDSQEYVYTPERQFEEEKNLDYIPSPYLNGVLDEFLEKRQVECSNEYEASLCSCRGCPFGCYYCYRSVKFESMRYFSPQRVYDEIEYGLNKFGVYRYFLIDDCFLTSKQRLKEFVKEFEERKQLNQKLSTICLNINSRPELIDEEVISLFSQINIKFLQIGLQTINPSLQKYMTRNIDVEKFRNISAWCKKYNIQLHLDVIIGLPGDTIEYFKKTLNYAVDLAPHLLQVKQLYHNPETKFFNEQDSYEFIIEKKKRASAVPYVVGAPGISNEYKKEAYDYLQKKIRESQGIYWKTCSEYGVYCGDGGSV